MIDSNLVSILYIRAYVYIGVIGHTNDCTVSVIISIAIESNRYQGGNSLARMNQLVRVYVQGTRLFHTRIVCRAINYYASIRRLFHVCLSSLFGIVLLMLVLVINLGFIHSNNA